MLFDGPWGTLTQYHHVLPNTHVLDQENRLFTFESTRQVTLTLRSSNILLFHLEYYGKFIQVAKKSFLSSYCKYKEIRNGKSLWKDQLIFDIRMMLIQHRLMYYFSGSSFPCCHPIESLTSSRTSF